MYINTMKIPSIFHCLLFFFSLAVSIHFTLFGKQQGDDYVTCTAWHDYGKYNDYENTTDVAYPIR